MWVLQAEPEDEVNGQGEKQQRGEDEEAEQPVVAAHFFALVPNAGAVATQRMERISSDSP